MAGWGQFFGGLMDKIPIQGRIERLNNQKADLEKEIAKLKKLNLDISRKEDREKAKRILVLSDKLDRVKQLLINKGA
jgi:hypothetical protein